MFDVVIVGAGPAGFSAAIYAVRSGLSALVLDKGMIGGQVALTADIDNYPGVQGITGPEFANNLYEHAIALGAKVAFEEVTALQLEGEEKTVTTSAKEYKAKTIILAGGGARRKLGCQGEEDFTGKGVSYCATCDGAFFRGQEVAIVGGGDAALEDAIFLANNCKKVTLIHRRDSFRGKKLLQDAVRARENIEIVYNATVEKIEGGNKVERCILNEQGKQRTVEVGGVFIAVGMVPETALLQGALPLSPDGYILAGEDCHTQIPGVFVAGDIRKKPLRQIVTATADGAVAAVAAAAYLGSVVK